MRRFDKKKNIFEANLRLEQERLFERINLNEVGDSKGLPYEIITDYGDTGVKIGFKVPKDNLSSEELDMSATILVVFKYDMQEYIDKITNDPNVYKNINDDVYGILIAFGVLDSEGNTSYPELKNNKVFSIIATVKNAIYSIINKMNEKEKTLLMIYSHPVASNDFLREKLYNLFYDLEIKKSKIMNGFKKFHVRGYSGIYNANLLNGDFKSEFNIKTIDSKQCKILITKKDYLINKSEDETKMINDFFEYINELRKDDSFARYIFFIDTTTDYYFEIDSITMDNLKKLISNFNKEYNTTLKIVPSDGVTITFNNKVLTNNDIK